MNRITTIDVTRGLVMVIMALDHVRDLIHLPALTQNPTDLTSTTAPVFLTRWLTHLCAPTFVFLSGTSAYLSLQKRNTPAARWFLLKRGMVLIGLELTVINFAFWFDIHFRTILLQVIFAIGGGLIVLSLLAKLSPKWIGLLGLVIIFGHDLLALVPPVADPAARFVRALLFAPDLFTFSPTFTLVVGYPLIPWLGIMLTGFAGGSLMKQPVSLRQRRLVRLGLGALGLFFVLRLLNGYGDPAPWAAQKNNLFTVLSFINVSKYPPSLLYTLLMIGIALLLLAWADGADTWLTRVLTVYGRVPLFYYIAHWYLVHLTLIGIMLLQGYSLNDFETGTLSFGRPVAAGLSLAWVYVVWLAIVAGLYPLCRWYNQYKTAHPEVRWLRYV